MAQKKGGALVLSSLADRMIVPTGSEMLAKDYNIDGLDIPSRLTLDDFEELGQRAIEIQWLLDHLPEIKEKLLLVIKGQASWEQMKCELMKAGYKGAGDIKKSTIDALIAEQGYNAKVTQQDYRLSANTRKFGEETTEFNAFTDSLIELDLASLRARNAATIEQKKQAANADDAEAIATWEADRKVNDLEAAAMLLQYGSAARSHPKFPGNSRAIGGSTRQQASFGGFGGNRQQPQYRDQLKLELNGNVAGAVNNVARRAGSGLQKVRNFFFGG
ncbi:hypothetical protein QT972_09845 [Microcoleus sp. herbarium7]|uniref:hypothetical protein n=1 Tax=Microcoleus sp. herbarium7 TaxID=3055435 RepID=UPI002FD1593A